MTITAQTQTRSQDLIKAIEDLRASRPTALRVLTLADDPATDAQGLAEAIDLDPLLTAQLIRLANSAAFGMQQRIASTQHAVSLIGFDSVRAVAALLASGLRNHKNPAPEGFWQHSAATAAGCSVVASRFGLPRGEAFSLGLLHDLGTALLFSLAPQPYLELRAEDEDVDAQCVMELLEFGTTHAQAAAEILSSWNFPTPFTDAIAVHHHPELTTPQSRVLLAGDALAHLVIEPSALLEDRTDYFESMGISADSLPAITQLTSEYAAEVLSALPR